MIFLSFFFLLKKLVQIYQCYAVLEIIQKRERGGGGGRGLGRERGRKGGDRRGGMETRGGERKMEKKQNKTFFNSLSLYFPTAPPQNPFAAAHSAASATPAAYTLGSTAGVRFSTSFCHSQGVKGKGEPANLPG